MENRHRTRRTAAALLGVAAWLLVLAAAAQAGSLTWSPPRDVDGTASFGAVSCPSLALCVAVDSAGDVVTSTSPAAPATAWKVAHVDASRLTGVSCWSVTQCAAVDAAGNVLLSANPTGGAAAWSSPRGVATSLDGVSCPTEFLCVAVGRSAQTVVTSDTTEWPPAHWNATTLSVEPRGVSCASASLCAIAASWSDGGYEVTSVAPVALSWTAAWLEGPYWVALDGVSCAAPSLCVATDNDGNVLTSNPTSTTSAWGITQVDDGNWMDGVSCASASFCVAVDSDGNALESSSPTGGAAAWSRTSIDGSNIVFAISCASRLLCVAGDENGNLIVGAGRPVSTSAPVVAGTPRQGARLTAQHAGWTNQPTAYAEQWLRCASPRAGCVAIPGAVGQAYTPTAADVGATLRVREVASNAVGSGAATSAATGVVQTSVPWSSSPPAISGRPRAGSVLTAIHAAWQNGPTTLAFAWLRCNRAQAACAAIPGATAQTYRPTGADVGSTLRVQESAANVYGRGAPAVSAATAVVKPPPPLDVGYGVSYAYDARADLNRPTRFRLTHVPRRARIELRCHASRCAFSRRRLRPARPTVDLLRVVRRVRLKPRSGYLELRIAAPGYVTEVLRFTAAGARGVTVRRGCLPPGAVKPRRC